jgi:hypothetical protein
VKKAARKAPRKTGTRRKVARKTTAKPRTAKKKVVKNKKRTVKKKVLKKKALKKDVVKKKTVKKPALEPGRTTTAGAPAKKRRSGRGRRKLPSVLSRERRRLAAAEREAAGLSVASDDRLMLSARAGRDELRNLMAEHTETSPKLTGGDIDARWEDAYAIGDEAPGGDNPTPDQDRVEEIGQALGITYQDDQELKGGDEITERDRHRWEYDPASSEDWPHKDKDKKKP